jgi:AbrB family looped-hinge helix DNA binding protein
MIVTISKGQQLTIPSEIRSDLCLEVGSKIELIRKGRSIVITPIEEDLKNLFEHAGNIKPKRKLTAKQMDEMIEHEIYR